MSRPLPDVISDILTYSGAIVEEAGNGYLDVMAPQEVSKVIDIPEYTRMCFSYDSIQDGVIYASYDSELFSRIARLLAGKGKFSMARLDASYYPSFEKLSKTIPEKIALNNATFRLGKTEVKDISYLLVYFRYTALSDEKTEGLIPVLINEVNFSTAILKLDIDEIMEKLKESNSEPVVLSSELIKALQSAYRGCIQKAKERLKDFIKSLERRLNRDIKRVYEYYGTLKEETKKAIEKKAASGEADKLLDKINVIEAEKNWKIQDLTTKYALNIQIEPVSVIRIETQAPILWMEIRRRLSSREFPIVYNPILRQIDLLPCESCFYPQKSYYICDDKLHIICSDCFRTCPDCGRQYCSACHNNKCPKCARKMN